MGSILGSGRSPEEGNGNPLQYSCLENSMNRGVWWTIVHGVSKSCTWQWLDSNNRGYICLFIYLWENDSIINILLKKLKPHDRIPSTCFSLSPNMSAYVYNCVSQLSQFTPSPSFSSKSERKTDCVVSSELGWKERFRKKKVILPQTSLAEILQVWAIEN